MVTVIHIFSNSSPSPILLPISHLKQDPVMSTPWFWPFRFLLAGGMKHQTEPGICKALHHLAQAWPFSFIASQCSWPTPVSIPFAVSAKHFPSKAVIYAQNVPFSLIFSTSKLLFIFPFLAQMSLSPDSLLWFIPAFSHPTPFPYWYLNICCLYPGMLITIMRMATSVNSPSQAMLGTYHNCTVPVSHLSYKSIFFFLFLISKYHY